MAHPPTAGRPGTACPVCGQAPEPANPRPCANRWCASAQRSFSVVFSVGAHRGALRGAITRYKYRGERRLGRTFAAMACSFVEDHPTWFEEFDLLTSVPSFTGAGARRSWDPVGTIVEEMAARLGAAWTVDASVLVKTAETPCMTRLSWSERQAVARGPLRRSLAVTDPARIAGAQILLFDDVMTDGSTLREAAGHLRRAGASDVAALVLARRQWEQPG
jgi:predicted amidophosphoribosyltransferase